MNRSLKFKMRSIFLLGLCALITACGSSEDDALTDYIRQVKSRTIKRIEPLPEFKPMPLFVYPDDTNRRSPFKPKPVAAAMDFDAPNLSRNKQPLEEYPLDALKFAGTLRQGNEIWGLIQQPNKMVMRVHRGDYMGQNYGQVVHIDSRSIAVEERVKINGRWEKRKIVLDLKQSS